MQLLKERAIQATHCAKMRSSWVLDAAHGKFTAAGLQSYKYLNERHALPSRVLYSHVQPLASEPPDNSDGAAGGRRSSEA